MIHHEGTKDTKHNNKDLLLWFVSFVVKSRTISPNALWPSASTPL